MENYENPKSFNQIESKIFSESYLFPENNSHIEKCERDSLKYREFREIWITFQNQISVRSK